MSCPTLQSTLILDSNKNPINPNKDFKKIKADIKSIKKILNSNL